MCENQVEVAKSQPVLLIGNRGNSMRYSGIGGQAVMEGVMMKNKNRYAVAVRKPDHEIEVMTKEYKGIVPGEIWQKIPLVRGVLSFIDSLVLGMSTLMYSASFFEDEDESEKEKQKDSPEKMKAKENAMMGGTVALSVILAIAIFMILPYYLSVFCSRFIASDMIVAVLEGILRLAIFIGYIVVISKMKEIQRVFMYHGAEHKCINCIEHGMELNVENVRRSSKEHKRCGTSFLMFVVILSVVLFLFIRVDSHVLRLVLRLALVPVIAEPYSKPGKQRWGYSSAWLHHKGRNKHHMEYWIDYGMPSEPAMVGMRMPDNYVVEMFIDRMSASKNYQKEKYTDRSALEYYLQGKNRHIMHPEVRELLEKLLYMLADEGEDATFDYIRREVLHNKK